MPNSPHVRIFRSSATRFIAACAAILITATATAGGKPTYVSVDVPGAQDTGCFTDCSVLINNWGEVAGSYLDANNVYHGFTRSSSGKLTTIDAPGADLTPGNYNGTLTNAINDAGEVIGIYVDASGTGHGFLRSPEGVFVTVDVPGYSGTTPIALNLEGSIVGYTVDPAGVFRGFLRTPDGKYQTWIGPGACDASPSTGCYGTAAFSINIFGVIAGGFENNSVNFVDFGLIRAPNGKFTSYSAHGAGSGSYQGTGCPGCAVALNQFGEIAGLYLDANGATHAYVRSPWGDITSFDAPGEGTLGIGCGADCFIGLNDFGTVTGSYLDPTNAYHGFIREADGKITTFDAPGADTAANDYNGTYPISINDAGVIVGNIWDAANNIHTFIRYP